jgi:hypothetical protein
MEGDVVEFEIEGVERLRNEVRLESLLFSEVHGGRAESPWTRSRGDEVREFVWSTGSVKFYNRLDLDGRIVG